MLNVWEHYITEVKSVSLNEELSEKYSAKFVDIVMIAECLGESKEYKRTLADYHWEEMKEQGYFMA